MRDVLQVKYFLLFHVYYGYANAFQCCVIRTSPLLIHDDLTGSAEGGSWLLNLLLTWQSITLPLQPIGSVGAARRCELIIQ